MNRNIRQLIAISSCTPPRDYHFFRFSLKIFQYFRRLKTNDKPHPYDWNCFIRSSLNFLFSVICLISLIHHSLNKSMKKFWRRTYVTLIRLSSVALSGTPTGSRPVQTIVRLGYPNTSSAFCANTFPLGSAEAFTEHRQWRDDLAARHR